MAPQGAREAEDIDFRLRHMDELGIDVQVLHSTIFILQVAERPEVEIPLTWGWNRWMADVWQRGQGRLRWSTVLPLLSIQHSLEQIRFAREHGAVAVFVRPIEGQRVLHDPYFHPIWEAASQLNMPVVIHVGNANPSMRELTSQYASMPSGVWPFSVQTIGAFHAWAMNGMPEVFPELRFGVVECSASWLPYVVNDWKRRFPTFGRKIDAAPMKRYRMYVACQTDDDISYLAQQVGEDNLLIGTDYGHTDQSSEIEAIRNLQSQGTAPPHLVKKILDDNPRTFYGL
jgi:predicted TIM-barrel fold metal-dependent hydrolase